MKRSYAPLAFILWLLLAGAALAQTSSAGLRSATIFVTESPQTLVTVVPPQKFILTDVLAAFRFGGSTSLRVEISDDSGVRLRIVSDGTPPSNFARSFVNGLVFTSSVTARVVGGSDNDSGLTISGKMVSK